MGFGEERDPSLVDIAAHKATVQPEFNENAGYSGPQLNSTDAASRMPFEPGQHRFWRFEDGPAILAPRVKKYRLALPAL